MNTLTSLLCVGVIAAARAQESPFDMSAVLVEGEAAAGLPDGARIGKLAPDGFFCHSGGRMAVTAPVGDRQCALWVGEPRAWRLVAKTGDPMPGWQEARFGAFSAPVLNQSGRLAFAATINGSARSDRFAGVWIADDKEMRLVARVAVVLPDGATLDWIGAPCLDDAGCVSFFAQTTDGGDGYWRANSTGEVICLAKTGGALANGRLVVLENEARALRVSAATGQVSFTHRVDKGGVCLFAWRDGRTQLIAQDGAVVDELRVDLVPTAFLGDGQVAYALKTSDRLPIHALVQLAGGTRHTLCAARAPLPGMSGPVTHVQTIVLRSDGEVAVLAASKDRRGVWVSDAGKMTPVALDGQPAPGTSSLFDAIQLLERAAGGQIVVRAALQAKSSQVRIKGGTRGWWVVTGTQAELLAVDGSTMNAGECSGEARDVHVMGSSVDGKTMATGAIPLLVKLGAGGGTRSRGQTERSAYVLATPRGVGKSGAR